MRRRGSPYSRIEEVRSSRNDVLGLLFVTVILAILLGLVTDSLIDYLQTVLPHSWWRGVVVASGMLAVVTIMAASWRFYGQAESQNAHIDLWLPYHFPSPHRVTIAHSSAYQPPIHARRAFMRRYRDNSPDLGNFLDSHNDVKTRGQPFQDFIADDQLALVQLLALYVLHRYGDESLGAEAPYGWWGIDLAYRRFSMDDLPPPLRDNPFLRADQRPDQWRLLLPEGVTFEILPSHWVLRHRRFGRVVVRWLSHITVAGRRSQPYRALTTNLKPGADSQLHVIGTRIEAKAFLRWTLLPSSEPFHHWAAGLLARLEEALDFGYYIATRPDRIIRDLEWKLGWVPEGSSIVEMLGTLEGRLDDLAMERALAALDEEDRD